MDRGPGASRIPVWLTLLIIFSPQVLWATEYAVTEITMGGSSSEARSINDSGAVTGWGINAGNQLRAFLYKNGALTELGLLNPTVPVNQGYALNKFDQTVGTAYDAAFHTSGVLWENSSITHLGFLPGGAYAYAYGINDAKEVVGFSGTTVPSFTIHTFHWKNGVMTDLGTLGGLRSMAWAINNKGQVVGEAEEANAPQIPGPNANPDSLMRKPTLWDNGTVTCLCVGVNDMEGGIAYAINESGQIVGDCINWDPDGTEHREAVVWQLGPTLQMTEIGALGGADSDAWGNNEAGEVVGWAQTASGAQHAFFWKDGVMTDLNSLIPASSGWELNIAYDINNLGQIVGVGTLNGEQRAFILTPPSTPAGRVKGDFNGDRKADILLKHSSDGSVHLWIMNGTCTLQESPAR